MSMDMNSLYSDIILEHNQNLSNKHELAKCNLSEHGHNPSCGDDLTLQADIEDGVVKDAAYTGHGCAISQASADIMVDLIKGKTVKEALRLIDLFLGMIKREITDDDKLEDLEDAIAFGKQTAEAEIRKKAALQGLGSDPEIELTVEHNIFDNKVLLGCVVHAEARPRRARYAGVSRR